MNRRVRLHPAARRKLDEAAEFYDSEGSGLGSAFLDEAERALQQIRAFPESSPIVLAPVRSKVLAAFPYYVMYSVIGDAVTVLAFAHHRRRPFYWHGRE